MIRTNSQMEESAEEQGEELVLVAVTYAGSRSLYSAQGMRTEGNYPSLDGFQQDETKLVILPSGSLGWWESHADFEVSYAAKDMARALLSANYLPDDLVGPGYDPNSRERLCDALGIEVQSTEEEWRAALEDVADYGDEEAPEEAEPEHSPRVERLVANTDRSILVKVAGSYDDVGEFVEGTGKDSYGHLGQYELAEFLAGKEDDEVDRRIDTAEMGGDIR